MDIVNAGAIAGRAGAPFRFVVEAGKVAEFGAAVHAGSGRVPVTFLESARLWQPASAQPWIPDAATRSRMLHGAQEYRFHGDPPAIGDVLVGQIRVDRVEEKHGRRAGRMVRVDLVTEFTTEDGAAVATARRTCLVTERPPAGS
jgi:hypothetical protein